jgi:hypothetical protein
VADDLGTEILDFEFAVVKLRGAKEVLLAVIPNGIRDGGVRFAIAEFVG